MEGGSGGEGSRLHCWASLRCPPRGGGSADRRQVVVSRDVAVHGEVVVAQRVLVGRVAEGTLTLCRQRDDSDKPHQRLQTGTVGSR